MPEHYYGILFAIFASILWSVTVTIIKPITNNIIIELIPTLCEANIAVRKANIHGPRKEVIFPDNE